MSTERSLILTSTSVQQKLTRMAHEIYELHFHQPNLILVAIEGNGVPVAKTMLNHLENQTNKQVNLVTLKMNKKKPEELPVLEETGLDFKKSTVVLVDDVINSGKTLLYASYFLTQLQVAHLTIATLINREHRKFPVGPSIVGLTLSTNLKEHVSVEIHSQGMEVYLESK
jgi:pyrimidine operon attenuation protein/uracil phosphoribosyltransferase